MTDKDDSDKTLALPGPSSLAGKLKEKLAGKGDSKTEAKAEAPKAPAKAMVGKFMVALQGPHLVLQGEDAAIVVEALSIAIALHAAREGQEREAAMWPLASFHEAQQAKFTRIAERLSAGWGQ